MNIDFYLAKHKHLMWKIRLKAFLIGIKDMDAKEVVSHHDCDLGKWMYGFALKEYGQLEEFVELENVHTKMHQLIGDIVKLKHENKKEDACKLFETMLEYSSIIITLLDKLDTKLRAENIKQSF